ncbi:uncharacterized protein LOC110073163 isoform X1 [Pogona vitticeps]
MSKECEDNVSGTECTEDNTTTLQKQLQDDFAQMESVQLKVKALSEDWLETHQRLKAEEAKVTELEAQIEGLNLRHEETKAALQADILRALAQVKEKEDLAEKLRAKVAVLERKVEAACQEAAKSAARLEKGAYEARLALEATLAELTRQKHMALEATVEKHWGEVAPHSQDVVDLEENEGGGAEAPGKDDSRVLLRKDAVDAGLGDAPPPPPQEANRGIFRPAASSEFNDCLFFQLLFSFSAFVHHNLAVGESAAEELKYKPPVIPEGPLLGLRRQGQPGLETRHSG